MTVRIIVSCDGPSEIGRCRAFLPTSTMDWAVGLAEARSAGWTTALDGTDRCPGHRGSLSSSPTTRN